MEMHSPGTQCTEYQREIKTKGDIHLSQAIPAKIVG